MKRSIESSGLVPAVLAPGDVAALDPEHLAPLAEQAMHALLAEGESENTIRSYQAALRYLGRLVQPSLPTANRASRANPGGNPVHRRPRPADDSLRARMQPADRHRQRIGQGRIQGGIGAPGPRHDDSSRERLVESSSTQGCTQSVPRPEGARVARQDPPSLRKAGRGPKQESGADQGAIRSPSRDVRRLAARRSRPRAASLCLVKRRPTTIGGHRCYGRQRAQGQRSGLRVHASPLEDEISLARMHPTRTSRSSAQQLMRWANGSGEARSPKGRSFVASVVAIG